MMMGGFFSDWIFYQPTWWDQLCLRFVKTRVEISPEGELKYKMYRGRYYVLGWFPKEKP